jgi:hypothetical protein
MLSIYSSPVIGRAEVLTAVSGADITSTSVFVVALNAAIGDFDISASSANAPESMLPTSLDRVRRHVVSQ